MSNELLAEAVALTAAAREAAAVMGRVDAARRNAAILNLAGLIVDHRKAVFAANAFDVKKARRAGLSDAVVDRLALNPGRVQAMADACAQVASLPDPVGATLDGRTRADGLRLTRVRVPLGVVFMIYEARPNVTVDAAALCVKSANACILRGGKEAAASNRALAGLLTRALDDAGLPPAAGQWVANPDRALVPVLLEQTAGIDVVVPRGGRGLVETVMRHSRIPVIKHLDGICHIFVDESADFDLARRVLLNAKTQRPATCNAVETLLVHRKAAKAFLPEALADLTAMGVEIRGDAAVRKVCPKLRIKPAIPEDWGYEFHGPILAAAVVEDIGRAIAHINLYGSRHTDAIMTRDIGAARRFTREVDSASVMVNASTRLADGGEYGLGAEIGISTDKIHARGPVGLEGLTTYKWIVEGDGHIRQ